MTDRTWTLEDVREANAITAEQHAYAYTEETWCRDKAHTIRTLPWAWITYVQRLCWQYGEAGALSRLNSRRKEKAA